jgi:peptidoglycan/LPS O-acetylase OafA/YrhL
MKIQLTPNREHIVVFDRGVTDVIKLLSIIIIASHHFFQTALTRGDGGLFASLYCSQAGYLGVALFFFLSGYGLTKSNQRHQMTFGEFINKRVLKIVLPMILANLLWAVFCFIAIDKLDLFGLSQKLDVNNVTLGGGQFVH